MLHPITPSPTRMNAGLVPPLDPRAESIRVSLLPIHEQNEAVGGRNGRAILEDDTVLACVTDATPRPQPDAPQESVDVPVRNGFVPSARGAYRQIHGQNEVGGDEIGITSLEDDAVLATAADPGILPLPDAVQGGVLEIVQNGTSSLSDSTRASGTSIQEQNEAIGDQSGRTASGVDAVITDAPDLSSGSLLLTQNGTVRRNVPPTGIRSVRGRRKDMEDAVCAAHGFLSLPFISPSSDLHYFAVYDGHGGDQVAMHCRERMHRALAEEILRRATPKSIMDREAWESFMKATFLRMDSEVASRGVGAGSGDGAQLYNYTAASRSETVGSTAIVAVLSCYHIIVANCGDSRAVLCRGGQAFALSQDHKPDREDELARIEAAGGRVFNWNGWRVLGVLAMSRAIGDHYLKPYVIADPDMTMTLRSEDDEFLILASDGLWDILSNQDACTFARRLLAANRDAQTVASILVQKAHERGSSDNISVVVVDLRGSTGKAL